MSLVAPFYLLALIPWALVVVALLIGRHESKSVPFLEFWRGPEKSPRNVRTSLRIPPIALVCILLAILLSILAAAGPRVAVSVPGQTDVAVIFDRGLTMSARDGSEPRWRKLVEDARRPLIEHLGAGRLQMLFLPEGKLIRTDWFDWTSEPAPAPADTRQAVIEAAARTLHSFDGPVILLSDQNPGTDDPRLIHFTPKTQPANVGIVTASLRQQPEPSVMVRVRNDSDLGAASLSVGGVSQQIELPPRGQERNYFVELSQLAWPIVIELISGDELPVDNRAILARADSWPRIDQAGLLPQEVQRVIQTYSRLRVPDGTSSRVVVTSEQTSEPAVIFADAKSAMNLSTVQIQQHPVTANVSFESLGANQVGSIPQGDWQPIASAGDRVLVAVRSTPSRQVWIGFTSESFVRSSDFVILWTNALDWAGNGGDGYRFEGVGAVPIPPVMQTNWQQKLDSLPPATRAGIDLKPAMLIAAMGLVGISALTWSRRA